jgi:hypothetical protein
MMKSFALLASVLLAACGSTTPRAETARAARPVVVEASPATTPSCERPEHAPAATELVAVLPEAERRVVAVELAQLDGRGGWEALLLVNEGSADEAVPKLYAFEREADAWRLLDTKAFELSMQPAEDEGAIGLRTEALLGPCHHVAWVDLVASNWLTREEDGLAEYVRQEAALVMLAEQHLETRLACEVAMRTETHDEERLIEGTNVTLSWSPDDPFPKPINVRRRTGLGELMRLGDELMVVDEEHRFEVEGWASGHVECRR